MKQSVAIVAAVNDDSVLSQNLLRSPWIKEKHVPVLVERGHSSASRAYNTALAKTDADIVVFAHQDVYLPERWNEKLGEAIQDLERHGERWGLLGVWGIDQAGSFHGRVWCSGGDREYRRGERDGQPVEVASIDEIVIVLKRAAGLRFDDNIPGFHLYATDIARQAAEKGYKTFVIHAPVIHNSKPGQGLDGNYARCYRYMQRKWRPNLPLQTCVIPVTRTGLPLIKQRLYTLKNRAMGKWSSDIRNEDPRHFARHLGYEIDVNTDLLNTKVSSKSGSVETYLQFDQ